MLNFQETIARLSQFWADRGCVIALPYDLEVGAGTMCPETFFRVLGPEPWKVAYAQPSRRPADGRYGENPNRLIKHTQFQVILKPPPEDIQNLYLESLESLGIKIRDHDIRFEEDNWESPTLGAWGIGWQVMLDGLEITQFTYFQQSGGIDLEPISVELTYGMERISAFLQNVASVFDVRWNNTVTYDAMRRAEEFELSLYDFESADAEACRKLLDTYEAEALRLLKSSQKPVAGSQKGEASDDKSRVAPIARRFPLRKVYELGLKCSHLFNILDARGAISVTERVSLIARVRRITSEVAKIYHERLAPASEEVTA